MKLRNSEMIEKDSASHKRSLIKSTIKYFREIIDNFVLKFQIKVKNT